MIMQIVPIGKLVAVHGLAAGKPIIALAGAYLVSVGIFAVWDTSTIALFGTLILTVGGAIVTLWPQLASAGVKAEKTRTDYAVQQATSFYREECERLRVERQQAHQMYLADLKQRSEEYRALERDLRLQCQRAESQLRVALTRATRYETMWRSATNQPPMPTDEIKVQDFIPPSLPATGERGASS